MKINLEIFPEFASEMVLSIPYAYYLHEMGKLGKLSVCRGMKPFYYFADDVTEVFKYRSLDNKSALKGIPNQWLHHSNGEDGVIDYSEWKVPPYEEHFKNNMFDNLKPYVIVNNIYNEPWLGNGCFDIKNLYDIFVYLTEAGYNIVYKRPTNKEFAIDGNEYNTISTNIMADVDGIGVLNDYQLCDYFKNVININKLWKETKLDYSTLNLLLFSETDGFITPAGAGSQLFAFYKKPLLMYLTRGREVSRYGYLNNNDCYYRKLANTPLHLLYDDFNIWEGNPNNRKYNELLDLIKKVFRSK